MVIQAGGIGFQRPGQNNFVLEGRYIRIEQAYIAIGQPHRAQPIGKTGAGDCGVLGGGGRRPGGSQRGDQRDVLQYAGQVGPGVLFVPHGKAVNRVENTVAQLYRDHPQHHFPQPRHNERRDVEDIEGNIEIVLQVRREALPVLVRRGYRDKQRIVEEGLDLLLVALAKQIAADQFTGQVEVGPWVGRRLIEVAVPTLGIEARVQPVDESCPLALRNEADKELQVIECS